MSLYAIALRFPFIGTKGPGPWKTAPDHYSSSTKPYSWHYALGKAAFSRVQWRQALHHSSRPLALCMVILGLCAAARPWKPISWMSQQGSLAVWNSVVSVATEDRLFLHTLCASPLRSRSVSLCGLPLHGWAVVAPRCFHFTITALTVDRGRAAIWWTELLERWHPMTMPRWKS